MDVGLRSLQEGYDLYYNMVSILVLVDVGLRYPSYLHKDHLEYVSILVLVDVGLRSAARQTNCAGCVCFNPCFSGCRSAMRFSDTKFGFGVLFQSLF